MKKIITIDEQSFGRNNPDYRDMPVRKAVRAVLLNDNGEVYLLHVTSHGYHKLPGGGIDEGEEIHQALRREIQEEVGCNSEIITELGEVIELRSFNDWKMRQISYTYVSKQLGKLDNQSLEQGEIDEGHDLVIAKDIDDAINILEADKPNNIEGEYIRLRDLTILKESKKFLKNKA